MTTKPSPAFFKKLIERFSSTRILVVGDIMVDRFIRGKVSRISPEAPVPVVAVREETDIPGGAGNVIMNLAALGSKVQACGVIGDDEVGKSLVGRLQESGVETSGLRRDTSRPTSLKTRVIAEHQQVVRFDHETVKAVPSHIEDELETYLQENIPQTDAVILSDYGKGVLSKKIISRSIEISRRHKKPVCVDPKIEHFQSYKKVTCITPNFSEAMGGMHRVSLGKDGVFGLGRDILKTLDCQSILITRGEEGMTLFEKNRTTHIPAKAQEIFDVTGAGDTVISVLSLALACGASLAQGAILANLAAGIVIGKLGTATVSPSELKEALRRL